MANTDEQTIINLEEKFWQAMVNKDVETSVAMLPEKSIVTGAQGVALLTQDDYRRMAVKRLAKLTPDPRPILPPCSGATSSARRA